MIRLLQKSAMFAVVLAAVWGGPLHAQGAGGNSLPDILGLRTGMTPGEAYNLLMAHDPAHSVALEQVAYPQLYGATPVTYGMNTATTGDNEQLSAEITLPPNPQLVWRIHRTLGRFEATKQAVLDSLLQKYGTPWNSNAPASPDPTSGYFRWIFNEQGDRVEQTVQARSLKNCINTSLQPWFGDDVPVISFRTSTTLERSFTRTSIVNLPPLVDPSKYPECANLVVLQVIVNGGTIRDNDLSFTLDYMVTDFSAQHRAEATLDAALNAIVQKGAQQQQNNAAAKSVPKL